MFRNSLCVVLLLAALATPAIAAPPDPGAIERIEATIKLPRGSRPLADYERYYAVDTASGRRMIFGLYLIDGEDPPGTSKLHLLDDASKLPIVMDGGCGVIQVRWDVASAQIVSVACNGLA